MRATKRSVALQKKYIVRLTNEEQERKPGSSTPDALEHHARRQSVWTEYANDRIQKFAPLSSPTYE